VHIEGRRSDIRVVDDRTRLDWNLGDFADVIDDNLDDRPVIAIEHAPHHLATLTDRRRLRSVNTLGAHQPFRVGDLAARSLR
jgi:hypothetical protein